MIIVRVSQPHWRKVTLLSSFYLLQIHVVVPQLLLMPQVPSERQ